MEQNRESKRNKDKNYFRQLFPTETKQYIRAVKNKVDGIEGRNSFIYDEYPDQIQLERLLEEVLKTVPYESRIPRESQKQILRILMYDEIYERRNR